MMIICNNNNNNSNTTNISTHVHNFVSCDNISKYCFWIYGVFYVVWFLFLNHSKLNQDSVGNAAAAVETQ